MEFKAQILKLNNLFFLHTTAADSQVSEIFRSLYNFSFLKAGLVESL